MILLLIASIVYALVMLPTCVRYAQYILKHESAGSGTLLILGEIFFVVALCLYMSSIGHLLMALIILIPTIVAFLVGVVVAIAEVS